MEMNTFINTIIHSAEISATTVTPAKSNIFETVILTAVVFAALITSLANIVISVINNSRLKNIEKQKQVSEIDKYRYSKLYELIVNWHKYDSATMGDTASEIANYKLLNLFMDDSGRYEIAKPLLDKTFIKKLEKAKLKCEELLNDLVDAETPDGTHPEEFPAIRQSYYDNAIEFSEILKEAINSQLEILLGQSK